jgi:type VI secretion system protein
VAGRGLLSRLQAGASQGHGGDDGLGDLTESIAAHLRVLLNTRKGEAVTAPNFGIVDFTELVHAFPTAIQSLQQSIRATILEFEPRLKSVVVRHLPDENPLLLKFEISAQLNQKGARGSLRFQTQVSPGGQISVW